MLDLSALKEVQQLTQGRDQRRYALSNRLYSESLECVKHFVHQGDSASLQQALDTLQQCLSKHTQQAEPYALLGIIFWGLNQPAVAVRYYKKASGIDPNHSLVQQFQGFLSAGKLKPVTQQTATDEDELLNQAHLLLQRFEQNLSTAEATFLLSVQPEQIFKQKHLLAELFTQSQIIRKQISKCVNTDVLKLSQQLERLICKLEAYQRQFELSQDYQKIVERSLAARQQVKNRLNELDAGISLNLDNLEELLDICDSIADHIDAHERKGHSITELLPAYKAFMADLTELQDRADN